MNQLLAGGYCRRAAGATSCSRFAPWKISFSGACLTIAPAVGACRTPVSRLFNVGVGRYADSVLIAAGDRNTCEADLELSRVTALKCRGDATPPARRQRRGHVSSPVRCGQGAASGTKTTLQAFRSAAALFRQWRLDYPGARMIVGCRSRNPSRRGDREATAGGVVFRP